MSELAGWAKGNAGKIDTASSTFGSLAGAGFQYYGAGIEGKQASDYYGIQSSLTARSKEEAKQNIALQIRNAKILQDQADDLLQEAEWTKQKGQVAQRKFQKATDKGLSSGFAQVAKSGVSMNYGSPMDVINEVATERAKDYDILKWENDSNYYLGKRKAGYAQEKATIMLTQAKMDEANLPMYDYQSYLYGKAGDNAMTTARLKQSMALINAASSIFGSMAKG